MRRKLTLDETWKRCLRMWWWIAGQKRKHVRYTVHKLKAIWLAKHYPSADLIGNCYFCEWADQHNHSGYTCDHCPGKRVERWFHCTREEYDYGRKPIKFFQEIQRLNSIRTKNRKER